MDAIESNWKTHDGLTIFARDWLPEQEPTGVICLVHGLGEHSGRYDHVADRLVTAGYAVMAFDLRGHGHSSGKRGHALSAEQLHEDMDILVQKAKKRFPSTPVFLYGHSLGGILTLSYTLSKKPDLAGVIVTGLAVRTALQQQKLKIAMAKILGRIIPEVTLPSGLEPASICSDPGVVDGYVCDPLVHDRISFGMSILLLREIERLISRAPEFHLPLLVMHGRNDRLGYPEGSEEFAAQVRGDCTLKIWEGMSHEIHNEPGKDRVFDFLIDWLDNHRAVSGVPSGQSLNLVAKFGGDSKE
jgi:alpha-beta hydrolase superfamily lysophospholipase